MHTIYRIQDSEGRGPYHGTCDIQGYFDDTNRHPVPGKDSKLRETAEHLFIGRTFKAPDFIFGFSTLAQLRAWFYKDEPLRILHENGYKLLHLEGECYHGNSQAVINKTTMKILSKTSLLTLLGSSACEPPTPPSLACSPNHHNRRWLSAKPALSVNRFYPYALSIR